jgi:hypothetical protein
MAMQYWNKIRKNENLKWKFPELIYAPTTITSRHSRDTLATEGAVIVNPMEATTLNPEDTLIPTNAHKENKSIRSSQSNEDTSNHSMHDNLNDKYQAKSQDDNLPTILGRTKPSYSYIDDDEPLISIPDPHSARALRIQKRANQLAEAQNSLIHDKLSKK